MTPANADLLSQLRDALDSTPSARMIADAQALRDRFREQLELPPDASDATILGALAYRLANRPSMSEIADAADARQLRDRVRDLERQIADADAELGPIASRSVLTSALACSEIDTLREDLARWRSWARVLHVDVAPADEQHTAEVWQRLTDEQVRTNVSAQVELMQHDLQAFESLPTPIDDAA